MFGTFPLCEQYFLEDGTPKLFQDMSTSPNISLRSCQHMLMHLVYATYLYILWNFVNFDDFSNILGMWTLFPGGWYSKPFPGYVNKFKHILDVLPTYFDAVSVRPWSVILRKICLFWWFFEYSPYVNIISWWMVFQTISRKSKHILEVLPTYADVFSVRHWSVLFMKMKMKILMIF